MSSQGDRGGPLRVLAGAVARSNRPGLTLGSLDYTCDRHRKAGAVPPATAKTFSLSRGVDRRRQLSPSAFGKRDGWRRDPWPAPLIWPEFSRMLADQPKTTNAPLAPFQRQRRRDLSWGRHSHHRPRGPLDLRADPNKATPRWAGAMARRASLFRDQTSLRMWIVFDGLVWLQMSRSTVTRQNQNGAFARGLRPCRSIRKKVADVIDLFQSGLTPRIIWQEKTKVGHFKAA